MKMFASSAFLGLALASGARQSRYGQIVLLGLSFSWLGDAFLLGSSEVSFLGGLVAFLIAHLCYWAAFMHLGVRWRVSALAFLPVIAFALSVVQWLRPGISADMVIPVFAYAAVISIMVALAAGATARGATGLVVGGAVLFFVSDLSVAMGQFLDTDFFHGMWGLPLYYAAQVLLALSISQIDRPASRLPR